jgi:uncharacterized protein (DUF1015 family)
MALIHPFRALRPVPEHAKDVACVPYDVINTEEARDLSEGNPLSFLHVIRPEIDLPPTTDEHAPEVYAKGAENLRSFRHAPFSVQDVHPSVYVYRLIMDGRSQTGVFTCVSTEEYDNGVILKHELTRPVKEDDRTRHILEQQAHAEPVMLAFRDHPVVLSLMAGAQAAAPLYDFTAEDGIQHTVWRISDTAPMINAFAGIPHLYVADGHHRCKAASRAAAELKAPADHESRFFPAVLFPMSQVAILPYNRIIRRLPQGPDAFLSALNSSFDVQPVTDPTPDSKGRVCLYLGDTWYGVTLPEPTSSDVTASLDVARLSAGILEPLLGITDPRRDSNIDFVGGIRGTRELERLVREGKAELAISMYPTSMDELVSVSDAGELMPPKSTWFEPKLRSGLLIHLFD